MFIACTDRARINPLDPKNPETLGHPTGVNIYSIQDTVYLKWDIINLSDLTGYQIYRKTQLDTAFIRYKMNPTTNNFLLDTDVEFGKELSYLVTAVGSDYESAPSDTMKIIPGPTFNWVANNLSNQLVKLTHDSQHKILSSSGFFPIIDIEPNPKTGEVWVIERIASTIGNVKKISPQGGVLIPEIEFGSPVDATLDINNGSLWVADTLSGNVVHINASGEHLASFSDFKKPVSVSVDQRTGDCWVVDKQLNQVAKVNVQDSLVIFSVEVFNSPHYLDVYNVDGSVWVAENNRVVRLNDDGTLALELNENFEFAFKLAVNQITGSVWIINSSPSNIRKFSADGFKLFEINGFSSPQDLSINLFDLSCLVADTYNNRLVRLTENGEIFNIFNQIGFPTAVKVQNQPLSVSEIRL